ncbi:hypothetical protein chiPu_0022152 [Chiloscyllium punctatum]|uniref:Uncharacterized protein n=1 Tax=Chiloscyllium punctatum TaxID=137246 RepID=A0A401RLB6_CHIPU|nr:hypothetical protein [Chiloscyllium punctatum]
MTLATHCLPQHGRSRPGLAQAPVGGGECAGLQGVTPEGAGPTGLSPVTHGDAAGPDQGPGQGPPHTQALGLPPPQWDWVLPHGLVQEEESTWASRSGIRLQAGAPLGCPPMAQEDPAPDRLLLVRNGRAHQCLTRWCAQSDPAGQAFPLRGPAVTRQSPASP